MQDRGKRKVKQAVVLSNKMDKTVVVQTERKISHPRYKKVITVKKKFKAHDQNNECQIGDLVLIMEVRPLSKDKRFRVVSILKSQGSKQEVVKR